MIQFAKSMMLLMFFKKFRSWKLVFILLIQFYAKGQLISKADWRAVDSLKKPNGQICFVCFFTVHGKQIRFLCSFFWENLKSANLLFYFIWPLVSRSTFLLNLKLLVKHCLHNQHWLQIATFASDREHRILLKSSNYQDASKYEFYQWISFLC